MKKILAICLFLSLPSLARAAVDFEKDILPIFEAHCIKCHGAEKAQAKLGLHAAEAIKAKMATDDHLIVAGNAQQSELYERLTLPADHKKRMPKGAEPLAKEKLDLIAAWIKEGAKFPVAAIAATQPSTESEAKKAVAPQETPRLEPLPLPEVPAPSPEAIDRLISAGAQVMPLFAGSPLLDVSFALSPHRPTDDTLKLLGEVAPQVISLNLKNAQASDEGWGVLGQLVNLTSLNVQNSSFSDAAARNLAGLSRLESLNLYGTHVTDAALKPLEGLKRLRKLYLWQTSVTYDALIALEKEIPGIEWNLGWDHPVIARQRLENQQAEFAELVKKAEADTARLKGELQVAEEAQATATKRLADVEAELAKLAESQSNEPQTKESQAN